MNWLDIALIVCLLVGAIKGLIDGLINQVVALLALAGGILFAGLLAKPIKELFLLLPEGSVQMGIINGVSYVLAFVVIMLVIVLLGKVVNLVVNLTPAVILNKAAGAILGVCLWALGLSLLLNVIATFDSNSTLIKEDIKNGSELYKPVKRVVPTVYPFIKDFFNK